MMSRELVEALLALNGIDEVEFYQKLYQTLLHGVFEVICKEMKKQNTKAEEKEKYRKHKDKIIATKNIVKKYAGCQLNDEGYSTMSSLLSSYFRTGDPRKRYDDDFREELIRRQGGRCAICRKQITANGSHLDHIVPWDYVGDNLNDNYQMLCETCNERKGTATYYELSMLLLNKR